MTTVGLHLTPSEVVGRVAGGRNQKRKNLLSGRHATEPYGGKTGGAMIKYPHTKKNAQRPNTHAYPASGPIRASHKYLYGINLLLDTGHSDICLSGHIRMVVELLIITYYVIAVPVALWAILR